MAAGSGGGVPVLRPGVPVPGAVGQGAERAAQPLVAAPAERRGLALAGLDRDGGLAGVGGERVSGGVTRPAVADLGEQLGGGHDAARVAKQRQEDLAIGVLVQSGGDLLGELLDLLDQRLDRRDQREDDRPARDHLRFADASFGRAPELCEQLGGLLTSRVALPGEKPSRSAARRGRARRRGSGSAPGTPARSDCRACGTDRWGQARTARAPRATGRSARPWRARGPHACGSAP